MNNETEAALIGAIILAPEQIDIVQQIVAPADFADTDLAAVFSLMLDMQAAGDPVNDFVLLASRLRTARLLEPIGGQAALFKMTTETQAAHFAPLYAREIATTAARHRLAMIATDIRKRCDAGEDPAAVANWIDSQLRTVTARESGGDTVSLSQAAHSAIDRIEVASQRSQSLGIPTGLISVDESMGGMYPGELAILAARPSIGKSALAAQIAMHNARRKRPVMFASLEMTSHDIALRAVAGHTGIDGRELRAGRITPEERSNARSYAASIASTPFYLWSARAATVAKIRAAVRVQMATQGVSLLVVDYLGLVHATDRRKARWEQITEVSNDLKSLALELEIPVLALCQLNREAERGAPRLDHLRDAGAIEQDADVVMLLHRESRSSTSATLDIAKARNGVTGCLTIGWDPAELAFTDAIQWVP